jgi:preprotein translocase subunit YajC
MNNIWIIAQTGGDQAPQTVTDEPMNTDGQATSTVPSDPNSSSGRQPSSSPFPVWLIGLMMVFMVFMLFRAPQKQKQQRKKLEQSLEKNDRVLTIGGIFGTIVDIKDDEVTLKVDESNNTKIKVKRSAIGRNMSKD